MQYHLDTIPVWEALEQSQGCLFCTLHQKLEQSELESSLGGSVMEPDARVRVNERGFCLKHHQGLYALNNRLGHALMTDSHTKELLEKLHELVVTADDAPARGGLLRPRKSPAPDLSAIADGLDALAKPCVICESIHTHMSRYFYTFLHLWKTDRSFRDKWGLSPGVCIPHAASLLRMAQEKLPRDVQRELAAAVTQKLDATLREDESDLRWFTQKFDYRNQDKPWNNSRNALERTIGILRGSLSEVSGKKT